MYKNAHSDRHQIVTSTGISMITTMAIIIINNDITGQGGACTATLNERIIISDNKSNNIRRRSGHCCVHQPFPGLRSSSASQSFPCPPPPFPTHLRIRFRCCTRKWSCYMHSYWIQPTARRNQCNWMWIICMKIGEKKIFSMPASTPHSVGEIKVYTNIRLDEGTDDIAVWVSVCLHWPHRISFILWYVIALQSGFVVGFSIGFVLSNQTARGG